MESQRVRGGCVAGGTRRGVRTELGRGRTRAEDQGRVESAHGAAALLDLLSVLLAHRLRLRALVDLGKLEGAEVRG